MPTAPSDLAPANPNRGVLGLYTATIFVAAALLFIVQPMVGKMVLPLAGGGPEAWSVSLVFFQCVLLAGYAWAHFSVRWLGLRRQAVVHAVVLGAPLLLLPVSLGGATPPAEGSPAPWLLVALSGAVGAPFFSLAAASPLLQRWLASTRVPAARDPYFLYSASNAGSLAGLLAYPFVVEPLLPLSVQARLFAVGYGAFVLLAVLCALAALRSARGAAREADGQGGKVPAPGVAPSLRERLFWVGCAAVPSSLLLGVTHYITTQVAPAPLFWVLPLAIYLGTYVVAFGRREVISTATLSRAMAIVAVALVLMMLLGVREPVWAMALVHLVVLATAGLICHGRLAARRPPPIRLTEFYLLIAVGGVLGGAFNALVAPYVFDDVLEYPIAVVLACLLRSPAFQRTQEPVDRSPTRARAMDVVLPVELALFMMLAPRVLGIADAPAYATVFALTVVPTIACFLFFSPRPVRFALGVAVLLAFAQSGRLYQGAALHKERTFFGVYRVTRDARGFHVLFNGSTIHGAQSTDPARAREPFAYYHPTGPGGGVMQTLAADSSKRSVALVGAGVGALAALAGSQQRLTLYEIDPAVIRIAEDPRYFSFLADSPGSYEAVPGDARVSLSKTSEQYDLIVLDAFSSGSIPMHLLTREAFALYVERLRPAGALLFHVSNRHVDLLPVLGAIAADLDLVAFVSIDAPRSDEPWIFPSRWVLVARESNDLRALVDAEWHRLLATPDVPLWTDDFSSLLQLSRW